MPQPRLILASTSAYRRNSLQRLKIPFECVAPEVDEVRRDGETAPKLVRRLSRSKAEAAAARHPGALVIGSDQAADLDGKILGKPGDHARAQAQLQAASGNSVIFHTGLCLFDTVRNRYHEHVDTTHVHFRPLHAAEIERYLQAERPYDCAGSFKSEALGITLFEAIESDDPTALVGLPLIALCRFLREAGLQLP